MTDQQREIKFRNRDPKTGKIVAYEVCQNNFWYHYRAKDADQLDEVGLSVGIYQNSKPSIREQFINLRDKNGVEIYYEDRCAAIDPLAKSPDDLAEGVIKEVGASVVLLTDDGVLNVSRLRGLEVIPAPPGEKERMK